jgi:hypothetical protein
LKRKNPDIDWKKPSIILDRHREHIRQIELHHTLQHLNKSQSVVIQDEVDEEELKHQHRKTQSDYDPLRIPIIEEIGHPPLQLHVPHQLQNLPPMNLNPMQHKSKLKKKKLTHPLFYNRKSQAQATTADNSLETVPPKDSADAVRLIGAAPFMYHVNQGDTPYLMYVHPTEGKGEKVRNAMGQPTQDSPPPENRKPTEAELLTKYVPKEYHEFQDVFSEEAARTLPPHRPYDLKIETIKNQESPFGKIYNMSSTELEALKGHINELLGKGYIRAFLSPAGAPVLFVKKKNGSL